MIKVIHGYPDTPEKIQLHCKDRSFPIKEEWSLVIRHSSIRNFLGNGLNYLSSAALIQLSHTTEDGLRSFVKLKCKSRGKLVC